MIQYNNPVYHDLITQYQTWPELKTYLLSLGLHISDQQQHYCIIRSKAGISTEHFPITRWFRSTVWDMEKNRPVSVAPPNATKQFPYISCQEVLDAGLICQEFLDGFMMNCFIANDAMIITSRSKLGGTGHFYSSKSFHDLFLEAIGDRYDGLDGPDHTKGELSVSYSFLVQHTEHRVVTPITVNRAVLIQKTTLMQDGMAIVEDGIESFHEEVQIPCIPIGIELSVQDWIAQIIAEKTWAFQGIVLKDSCGNRWRFRNESYMQVKALRGNTASHVERFAQLYRMNSIDIYLHYYPLESYTFVCNNVFMNMIHQTVYNYYVQLHITKTISMDGIDKQYRRHVWMLHKHYMNVLRPLKKKITYNEVACYFVTLPWQVLAYLLRISQDSYFSLMNDVVSQ